MAHQSQLESRKYRNWLKAGLGLKYTKDGLEPFCDQLVTQQHVYILNKVKQKHSLSAVSCGNCDIKTLQPDHDRSRSKQCPLGQTNCNCKHPSGKTFCCVCSAIYDEIVKCHASTPPSPYWRNTNAKQWCTEPWSVAKCFINAAGYEKKLKASEFDCSGLLHVLLNNMDFRDHLNCTTDGIDFLQKVLQHRNIIYHSHDMELEDEDVTSYLDDMIALLQDGKELFNTKHSKAAVVKLEELKREDSVITTTNETEIRIAVMADVDRITVEAEYQKNELEKKGKEESDQIVKTGMKQKTDLNQKELDAKESIKDAVRKGKTDLTEKGEKQKRKLEEMGKDISDQVITTGKKQKTDLNQMEVDIKENIRDVVTKGKNDLTEKGDQIQNGIVSRLKKQQTHLDKKDVEIKETIEDFLTKGKTDLAEKGNQVRDEIVCIGTEQKADLDRKEIDIKANIRDAVTKGKNDLTEKWNQIKDDIMSTVTILKANLGKESIAQTTRSELEQDQKQMKMLTELTTNWFFELEQKVKRATIETGQTQRDLDYNHKKKSQPHASENAEYIARHLDDRHTNETTYSLLDLQLMDKKQPYPPRYPHYVEYNLRLNSFARWVHLHQDPTTMCNAGFFFTNQADLVRCYQCGIGLKDFSYGDDPLKEHVRHSRDCPFLQECIEPKRLAIIKGEVHREEHINTPSTNRQEPDKRYRHQEYMSYNNRLCSFSKWPPELTQTPHQLAEAGLFYTGFEDLVRCFACGGGMHQWDTEDDPWIEHCRWFPNCPYARDQKGEEYIRLIQASVATEDQKKTTTRSKAILNLKIGADLTGELGWFNLKTTEIDAVIAEHRDTFQEMGYSEKDFQKAAYRLIQAGTVKPTIEDIVDAIDADQQAERYYMLQRHHVKKA